MPFSAIRSIDRLDVDDVSITHMAPDSLDLSGVDFKKPLLPLLGMSLGSAPAAYRYFASAPMARSIALPSFSVTMHLIANLVRFNRRKRFRRHRASR
ncbi:hypothetical protein UNPF46_28690 [Bradyrhizobium sp. UNPF46]|nr:hypothetical protein UNPF46_28690 [Bradyrhizobium sp. UNPF46]